MGAATDPLSFAYTVWYRSASAGWSARVMYGGSGTCPYFSIAWSIGMRELSCTTRVRRSVVADAEESSAENASGVEHERVTGGNELLQIAELSVRDLAGGAVHHHEPALSASRGWRLRDAVDWDVEVVVGGAGAVFGHERIRLIDRS